MVIYASTGQVKFNVQISKGMSFHEVAKETDGGKSTYVRFGAVVDASKGMETFMLQVKPDFLSELIERVEGAASN